MNNPSTRVFALIFIVALATMAALVVAPSTGPMVRSEFRLVHTLSRNSFEWQHGVVSAEPHPLPDENGATAAYHARLTKAPRNVENFNNPNREPLSRLAASLAARKEIAGERQTGYAIRIALIGLGGMMRSEGHSTLVNMAGISVASYALSRVEGDPYCGLSRNFATEKSESGR